MDNKMKDTIKNIIPYIIVIIIVVLLRCFIITPVHVVGSSMNPNLKNGELMLLNKIKYRFSEIERFDIVVVDHKEKPLIKRVIGLPGEKVEYKDNVLYINGEAVEEKFEKNGITYDYELSETGYDVIPENMYFVVGDNRINSSDSRTIGLIERKEITGKANFILIPFDNFGFIE